MDDQLRGPVDELPFPWELVAITGETGLPIGQQVLLGGEQRQPVAGYRLSPEELLGRTAQEVFGVEGSHALNQCVPALTAASKLLTGRGDVVVGREAAMLGDLQAALQGLLAHYRDTGEVTPQVQQVDSLAAAYDLVRALGSGLHAAGRGGDGLRMVVVEWSGRWEDVGHAYELRWRARQRGSLARVAAGENPDHGTVGLIDVGRGLRIRSMSRPDASGNLVYVMFFKDGYPFTAVPQFFAGTPQLAGIGTIARPNPNTNFPVGQTDMSDEPGRDADGQTEHGAEATERLDPRQHWPKVTAREHQVWELVAQGHTNRQIADRLFISEGTIKMHLHNIYGKLGVDGRLQLARYAKEKGLV